MIPRRRSRSAKAAPKRIERPTGVGILAVLFVIGALFLLVAIGGLGTLASIGAGGLISTLAGFGTVVLLLLAVLLVVAAALFWVGNNKAGWWLGVVIAGLSILAIVTLNVVSLVIGLIMAYYLWQPNVKSWFGV